METRKNTVKLAFESKAKVPSYLEVLRFLAKGLEIPASMVHSVYKDENEQCFFLKLMDRDSFNDVFEKLDDQHWFHYADGQRTVVSLQMASRQMKYVRIFNLPPEAEDRDIEKAMSRFGKVRQHVRERYPVSCEYPVYSGVRGVYMEVEKEIPAGLYIGHFRARLFYEGLKNKCFFCKAEGHVKANCPKLAGIRDDDAVDDQRGYDQQNGGNRLYSKVVANLRVAGSSATDSNMSMTVLPLTKATSNQAVAEKQPNNPVTLSPFTTAKTDDWNAIVNDEQSLDSFDSAIEQQQSGESEKQKTNSEMNETAKTAEAAVAIGVEPIGSEDRTNENRSLIDFNDGAVGGTARAEHRDDGGDDGGVDDTMMVKAGTSSASKRPANETDDGGDFIVVGKGKGTGAKKKGSPLQEIRDRSRSLNRRNRKA